MEVLAGSTAAARKIKMMLIALVILLVLSVIAFVALFSRPGKQDATIPFKAHMEVLAAEIKELQARQRADSVDRASLLRKIDTLAWERTAINEAIHQTETKINTIKKEYEKINVRYNDVSDDSLARLFADRFGR